MNNKVHIISITEEAQSGKNVSIESPLLYSSPNGYKMRACLYLNGHGNARGTHLSLFIRIFKNEYDAILHWPFNTAIEFCLFDQTGDGHHIFDKFYPDIKSSSFQRPTSEKNPDSGIVKFCHLEVITQSNNRYVDRDTMFIKVQLDFDNLSREILPFTSALNPGLPIDIERIHRQKLDEQYKKARPVLLAHISHNENDIVQNALVPAFP